MDTKGYINFRNRKGLLRYLLVLIFILTIYPVGYAIQRFPKPEFESGYVQPETLLPSARAEFLAYLDVVVLIASLSFISWLVIKRRSRLGVFWTSMFSLAYFGFYRQGCVCSIGSIQNISLALFNGGYIIPVTALAFFVIPLIYTLFFGRTFCAGVCPFGAIQDLVAFRPQKIGIRLNTILGVIPYLYLGLAVLYAATGTDFIICRYDPFVGIFRMNSSLNMFAFAGILLVSGIFIARPYCRFICPYGVLLNWFSRFSRKHLSISPAHCVQCRLCENSCPYDAIEIPVNEKNPLSRQTRVKKLILISILIPFLILAGGFAGSQLSEIFAGVNSKVKLVKQVLSAEKQGSLTDTFEMQAYKSSGKPESEVYSEALSLLKKFHTGSWVLGGFIGLVFGLLIAGRMLKKYNPDYVPHKGRCLSCARCIDYCPIIIEK